MDDWGVGRGSLDDILMLIGIAALLCLLGRIKRGYERWVDRLEDRIARNMEFPQMINRRGKRKPGTLVRLRKYYKSRSAI
jgi:hypothetical protein